MLRKTQHLSQRIFAAMMEAMRDKVLAALAIYYEGGPIAAARKAVGIRAGDFYDALFDHPDLKARYQHIKKARGDMFADEAVGVADDMGTNKGIADFRCA